MIETDKRKAVFLLHQEGQPAREIARLLGLSRNTVRAIIGQGGAPPPPRPRADQQPLDEELLRRLYQECQGRMARVHEKLVEEAGVAVTYSTLTRRLRELGIRRQKRPVQPAGTAGASPPCAQSSAFHRHGGKAPARPGARGQRVPGLCPADQRPPAP